MKYAHDSKGVSSPLGFVDSQDADGLEPSNDVFSRRLTPELHLPSFATPLKKKASYHSPSPSLLPSARRSATRTPKVRLRHNDSQIQFAAVESSPLTSNEHDLPMLTERQKEVRERQGREAAMFPKIGSSPKTTSKVADHSLPRLDLKSKQRPRTPLNADEDTSPTFPPDNMMNGFLGSSPTPSSSRHRSQERFSDDGPASSPTFVSSHLQMPPSRTSSPHLQPQPTQDHVEKASQPASRRGSQNEEITHLLEPYTIHENSMRAQGDLLPKDNVFSDQDVFVDAPAEPQSRANEGRSDASMTESTSLMGATPTSEIALSAIGMDKPTPNPQENPTLLREGDVSKVMNSFQSEATSRYSADDEQAAAQLLAEMEDARSQKSERQDPSTSRKASRKRTGPADGPSRKRARTSFNPVESPAAKAASSAGEVAADCVLIDSRPARGLLQPRSPDALIKRERSESPSAGAFLSSMEETHMPGRRRSGRPRLPVGNQQATQDPTSVRRSGYKMPVKQEDTEDSEHQSLRFRRGTRRSVGTIDLADDSPVSSNPLHGDHDVLPSSVSSSAMETSHPDAAVARPDPQPTSGTSVAQQGDREHTGQSLLERFRNMFEDLKRVAMGPEEERAMVTLLFESVHQIHDAGRRHSKT